MSVFEQLLLCGLTIAALLNWGNWRAWAWLAAGAASYIVSSLYFNAELPLHPFFTALCDAAVCMLIYQFGRVRWELPLFAVFQFSVLVSFTALLRLPDAYQYALLLELANWAALLIIGGVGTVRLTDVVMGKLGGGGHSRSGLSRVVSRIYAPARIDPWWWARGWLATAL